MAEFENFIDRMRRMAIKQRDTELTLVREALKEVADEVVRENGRIVAKQHLTKIERGMTAKAFAGLVITTLDMSELPGYLAYDYGLKLKEVDNTNLTSPDTAYFFVVLEPSGRFSASMTAPKTPSGGKAAPLDYAAHDTGRVLEMAV